MEHNSNAAEGRIVGAGVGAQSAEGLARAETCNATSISSSARTFGFGQAIERIKSGEAVQRAGWNGKDMAVFLNKGAVHFGSQDTIPPTIDGIRRDLFEQHHGRIVTRLPNITMRTATGSLVSGWLASQADMLADMLADDWQMA